MAIKEEFWKKVDYRKKVVRDSDGVVFCIAYESDTKDDKRLAVRETDYADYRRIYGWLHSGKTSPENAVAVYQAELGTLITEISLEGVSPADMVKFVAPTYETKFYVEDFGKITIDGEEYTVSYIDEYHFDLINEKGYGTPYHICQFAEFMERSGRVVKPVVPKGELSAEDIEALLVAASGEHAYWHDKFMAVGRLSESLGEHVKWGGEVAFIEHGRDGDVKNRLSFDNRSLMAGLRCYELITRYDSNYEPLFDKSGKFVPETVEAYDGVIADAILQFTVFGDMKY